MDVDQRCRAEVQEGGQGRVVSVGVGRNGPVIVGNGCRGKGRSCGDGVGVAWGRREVRGVGNGCGRRGRRCGDLVVVAGRSSEVEGVQKSCRIRGQSELGSSCLQALPSPRPHKTPVVRSLVKK